MNKVFTDNGFLSDEGKKLLTPLKQELEKLLSSVDVQNMNEGDLRILSANLSKLVADKMSAQLSIKKSENQMKHETMVGRGILKSL